MPATTTGGPFDLNVPSSTNDFADLYGTYLVPNMETINDNAAHKGTAQTFTAAQTFSTTLTVTAGGANIGGDVVVSSGSVTGVTLKASGLTGATQVSRYVGATTSGAPSTGTFSTGDYVIDQSGAIHVCTAGGSPGTWTAIGNVTYGTPGSSAVGDSAAAGSATTSARSDHRHGREAFGSPTSLTFGGSSTDGTSTSLARADHVHGLASAVTSVTAGTGISVSGTTALTVSATGVQSLTAGTGISVSGTTTPTVTNSGVTSIVAGTNVTVSGATGAVTINAPGFATPGSSAIGDTAAAGTATTVSRSDHVHGREAFGTPVALSGTAGNGSATTVARSDHQHGGTVAFPLGSASAPSITPVSDADTGVWSPAANTLAVSTGGTERVRFEPTGQVLVGTTSLSTYFTVGINGNVLVSKSGTIENVTESKDGTAYLEINACLSSGTGNAVLTFSTSNVIRWHQFLDYSTNRLYIWDQQSNDGVYLAQNSTSWTANSDSRLKDVQGTITDALAKVGQLTGVKFTWKRDADNPDAKVRVGLIAQDVQAVLPEAVDDESPDLITDEETGKVSGGLGVRYTELVPLLVNAIKELAVQHQQLQVRVANLEAQ